MQGVHSAMKIENRILKTEAVRWRELRWVQGNLKSISKSSFERLKQSLLKNSFVQPFNVWDNGGLWCLDGHHRQRAMQELEKEGVGIPETLPANFIDCKDEREAKKLVLVYSSIYARTDEESLYEFIHVNELNFDDLKLEIDLPEINLGKFEAGWMRDELQEDEVPEVPVEPRTKRGDLYELGRHRLLCGDSTIREDVERVMDGRKAQLFCTDPPYGVQYGELKKSSDKNNGDLGRTRDWFEIENDNLQGEESQKFLTDCFLIWKDFLELNAAWYLWHAQKVQGYFTAAAAAAAADVLYHRQIVWVKPRLILGRGHYHWRHELCLYGWRKGFPPDYPPDRSVSTVWEFKTDPHHLYQHPTQKPLECFAWPMRNSTQKDWICAEPFAGSGTQFLAAEQIGRLCYGMEIEPRYCDVTVQRWVNLTKQTRIRCNDQEIDWPLTHTNSLPVIVRSWE